MAVGPGGGGARATLARFRHGRSGGLPDGLGIGVPVRRRENRVFRRVCGPIGRRRRSPLTHRPPGYRHERTGRINQPPPFRSRARTRTPGANPGAGRASRRDLPSLLLTPRTGRRPSLLTQARPVRRRTVCDDGVGWGAATVRAATCDSGQNGSGAVRSAAAAIRH